MTPSSLLRRACWCLLPLILSLTVQAQVGRDWRLRSPKPWGDVLTDVLKTDTRLIAASRGATVLQSLDDGANWSVKRLDKSAGYFSDSHLAWNGESGAASLILASTEAGVWKSTTGDTWAQAATGLQSWERILCMTWTGSRFAAIQEYYLQGDGNRYLRLITSDDGRDWSTLGTVPGDAASYETHASRLLYTGTRYIMSGFRRSKNGGVDNGLICSTEDGETWDTHVLSNADDANQVTGLTMNGLDVVGVGAVLNNGAGQCYVSSDNGATFTRYAISSFVRSVAATGTHLVATGYYGAVATSTDNGQTWTGAVGPGEMLSNAAIWAGTQLVVVGSSGGIFTADGTGGGWTRRSPTGSMIDWKGVAVSPTGVFAASDFNGQAYYSSDGGDTWTLATSEVVPVVEGLAWDGTRFVSVTGGTFTTSSADGLTWTPHHVLPGAYHRAVAISSGMLVAAGNATLNFEGAISTSVDNGDTWTPATLPAGVSPLQAVARFGPVWVAAGDGSTLITSANGTSWTKRTIPEYVNFRTLAAGNSLIIAAGQAVGTYYTSTNGTTWTKRSFPEYASVSTVVWTGANFVAIAEYSGMAFTSANGIAWTPQYIGTGMGIRGAVWDASRSQVVAVADGGVVISTDVVPVAEFSITGQIAPESNTVPVQVTLSFPAAGTLNIPITTDGTADLADYADVPAQITFNPGELSKTFHVTIVPDFAPETDETLELSLGAVAGMRVGEQGTHTVTILDNDGPPAVSFTDVNIVAREQDGVVTARVALSWPVPGPGSVIAHITLGGTASNGDDYTAVPTDVTFNAGEQAKFISLYIADDGDQESMETLTLTLTPPTGGTLAANNTELTVHILDNDPGYPGQSLTLQQQKPVADSLSSIASNGATQVIVGAGGLAMSSSDAGATWTRRYTGSRATFNRVFVLNSFFLAIGDEGHAMIGSPNGDQWSEFMVPGAEGVSFCGGASDGTRVVLTGESPDSLGRPRPVIFHSSDMLNWEQVALPPSLIGSAQAVVWNSMQNQFVLVGGGTFFDEFAGKDKTVTLVLTSTNGVYWTDRSVGMPQGVVLENLMLTADHLTYIATGESKLCFTSNDGVTWTQKNMGAKQIFSTEPRTGSAVIGVGYAIASSTNGGATWTQKPSPTKSLLVGIVKTSTGFITISENGGIYTSPDGIAWTKRSAGSESPDFLAGVAWSGTQFVAVGGDRAGTTPAQILTSPDGLTWTPRTTSSKPILSSVVWNGSLFCAVGYQGSILTSANGIAWTPRTSGTKLNLKEVIWTGSQFVVVGGHQTDEEFTTGPGGAVVLTSPNGTIWTRRTVPTGKSLEGVCFTGSLYVAVGRATASYESSEAEILTSTDAITWTHRSSGLMGVDFESVTWDGFNFFAAHDNFGLQKSPDGITWAPATGLPALPADIPRPELQSVINVPEYGLLAVGTHGVVLMSMDQGDTWKLHQSDLHGGALVGLCWNGARLVVVGANASIHTAGGAPLGPIAVNFDLINAGHLESAGAANVLVRLSRSAAVPVTVNFVYTPNAMIPMTLTGPDADVTLPVGPLVFKPGEVAKYLTFPIKDDKLDEGSDEILEITFGAITGAEAGTSINSHVLYVTDNDQASLVVDELDSALLTIGNPLLLKVIAVGSSPLTYLWKFNGKVIPGVTGNIHYIPVTKFTDGGTYTCTVTNSAGTDTSTAEVGIHDPTLYPLFVPGTADVVLKSKATGPLTYSWLRDSVPFAPPQNGHDFSPDQKTLTIRKPFSTGGTYQCEIRLRNHPSLTALSDLFVVSVANTLPNIDTLPAALPAGDVGVLYDQDLSAYNTGGLCTWSATGLPAGISIDLNTGRVRGYSTIPGTKTITIKATNNQGTVSKTTSLTINGMPAALVGTSTGLISRTAAFNNRLGSYIKLDVLANGTFSGSFTTGVLKLPFTGQAVASSATVVDGTTSFYADGKIFNLTFQYDDAALTPATGTISSHLPGSVPSATATFLIDRPKKTGIADFVGRYNYALDLEAADQGNPSLPQGTSFGSVTIAANGTATFAGRMSDNSVVTASDFLSVRNMCTCYASLYAGKGSFTVQPVIVLGSPLTDSLIHDDFAAPGTTATWNKLPDTTPGARLVPGGFVPRPLSFTGTKYNPPATNTVVMDLTYFSGITNAALSFAEGGVEQTPPAPFANVTIKPSGTIETIPGFMNYRGLTLTVTNKTGEFKSTFNMNDYGAAGALIKRPVTAYGQIVRTGVAPNVFRGVGHFLLPQLPSPAISPLPNTTPILSGKMELTPLPAVP